MKVGKQDASVVLDITTYEANLRKMTIYRTNKKKGERGGERFKLNLPHRNATIQDIPINVRDKRGTKHHQ